MNILGLIPNQRNFQGQELKAFEGSGSDSDSAASSSSTETFGNILRGSEENTPKVSIKNPPQEQNQSLQKFLKRMETELGLLPNDILMAFGSLSVEELVRPPEQNIDRFVEVLNIEPQQESLAKDIFVEMLGSQDGKNWMRQVSASSQELQVDLLGPKDIQYQKLDRSLDQMQKAFFSRSDNMPPSDISRQENEQEGLPVSAQTQTDSPSKSRLGAMAVGAGFAEAGGVETGTAAVVRAGTAVGVGAGTTSAAGVNIKATQSSPQEFFSPPFSEASAQSSEVSSVQNWTLPKSPQSSINSYQKSMLNNHSSTTQGTASSIGESGGGVAIGLGNLTEAQKESMGAEQDGSSDAMLSSMQNLNEREGESSEVEEGTAFSFHIQGPKTEGKTGASPTSFMVEPLEVSEEEQAANTRDLVQQAQLMLKKGGGEMKLRLNPEGLGEVTMKVAVENGKVQVEMVTETNEAKKILEKGLSDLKTQLMAHKLGVEQLKVDSATDISKFFQEQQEQTQKQFAQNFMEQFRHENSGMRRGLYDFGGPRAPRSQGAEEVNALEASENRRRSIGQRRLDLVA